MPKYRLLSRMSSFFLIFFISAMSFGSNKASFMAEATWHPMLPLKSFIDASSRRGSPSCIGAGSHACGSGCREPDFSWPYVAGCLVFCCFAARRSSSSRVGRDLLVFAICLPFCSLCLFCLAALGSAGCGDKRGGWRGVGGGDLAGRDEAWDGIVFAGADFPGWPSISSSKLFWGFLCIPISSGSSSGLMDWSKSPKSFEDYDTVTMVSSPFFFFLSIFFLFPKGR